MEDSRLSSSGNQLSDKLYERLYKYWNEAVNLAIAKYRISCEEAEDMVADSMYSIATSYREDSFESEAKLKSALFLSVRNRFINFYRRAARWQELEVQDYHKSIGEHTILEDTVSELKGTLSYEERLSCLGHANGFSYEEIALILDRPIGTIKSIVHSARTKCRTKLKSI